VVHGHISLRTLLAAVQAQRESPDLLERETLALLTGFDGEVLEAGFVIVTLREGLGYTDMAVGLET
jgi:hypothetical protein